MPVQHKIDGQYETSYSSDARYVSVVERNLLRALMEVQSNIDTLIEMAGEVAEDGCRYDLDSDLRQQIAQTGAKLTDIHSVTPKPKLEVVR